MNAPSLVDPDRYTGTVTYVGALPCRRTCRRLRRGGNADAYRAGGRRVRLYRMRATQAARPHPRGPCARRRAPSWEPSLGAPPEPHPIGRIQLLATIDQASQRLQRGLKAHPRVGDGVYLASGSAFGSLISNTTNDPGDVTLEVGTLDAGGGVAIKQSAEKLFARHCGVLGATGGGKSWTIATLLQRNSARITLPPGPARRQSASGLVRTRQSRLQRY